jgi:DNA polymerase III epsilon subunit-like protein
MDKIICVVYTETNGLHKNVDLCKKNLYCFSRLVILNYNIGIIKKKKFISNINKSYIIKPRCMYITEESIPYHNITQEYANNNGYEIEEVLNNFKKDLNNVDIIISHNIDFHIKTILSEYIRYNINIDFSNYIIIDTMNFFHKQNYIKLYNLYKELYLEDSKYDKINTIILVFIYLYYNFKKSIK